MLHKKYNVARCIRFYVSFTFLNFKKKKRDVTNFEYVFVTRFHITHKNFVDNWINSCTVIVSIKKNSISIRVKKIEKIYMDSQKSIFLNI